MNLLLKNNEVLAVKCNQIFLNSYISHIIYTNCGLGVRHAPSFETPTQLGIYTLTYSMPGLLTGIGLEVTLQARPSPHCTGHFHSLTPREVQGEFFFSFSRSGIRPRTLGTLRKCSSTELRATCLVPEWKSQGTVGSANIHL